MPQYTFHSCNIEFDDCLNEGSTQGGIQSYKGHTFHILHHFFFTNLTPMYKPQPAPQYLHTLLTHLSGASAEKAEGTSRSNPTTLAALSRALHFKNFLLSHFIFYTPLSIFLCGCFCYRALLQGYVRYDIENRF